MGGIKMNIFNFQRMKEIAVYLLLAVVLFCILAGTLWFEYYTRFGRIRDLEKRIQVLEKIHKIDNK